MDIYDRINDILKLRIMSRRELCARTGISYSTLTSMYRRRSQNISLDTIRLIAVELSVSIDYLILGRQPAPDMVGEPCSAVYGMFEPEEAEICQILKMLSKRNRTILLAKAYELQEREQEATGSPRK